MLPDIAKSSIASMHRFLTISIVRLDQSRSIPRENEKKLLKMHVTLSIYRPVLRAQITRRLAIPITPAMGVKIYIAKPESYTQTRLRPTSCGLAFSPQPTTADVRLRIIFVEAGQSGFVL